MNYATQVAIEAHAQLVRAQKKVEERMRDLHKALRDSEVELPEYARATAHYYE